MVITSRKGLEVIVSLNGSGIFALCISDGSSIFSDFAIHNIISNISSKEETLVGDDGIRSERGSLEQVEECTGMECGVSIMDADLGILGDYGGQKCRSKLEFYAASNLIVELNLGIEGIGRSPALREGDTAVSVFAFELA